MAKNPSLGIGLGMVALFMVLCGIAEVLEVPVIYGLCSMPLLLIGFVFCVIGKSNV